MRQLPGAFGDPFRAVETMPGVTPIISGVPFFFVRGAPPGNVGYFFDGIRVPLLYHVGAGPSVIHPSLVRDIDPAMPELGTRRNQLAFAPGRSVEQQLSGRIWNTAWGTVNYGLDHTSVCEATRHVANNLITWDPAGTKTSMGGGRTEGWQPDILGAEYIIFFGANPLEADFPMVGMARNLMQFKRNGGRYVTVDPRVNNTAALGHQWVPITPGTDAALALGMMNWISENSAYDARYLTNTN